MMEPKDFTAEEIAALDWSGHSGTKPTLRCLRGHVFSAHAKFSIVLKSLVSKEPCPVCGTYDMRSASHDPEPVVLCIGDVRNV